MKKLQKILFALVFCVLILPFHVQGAEKRTIIRIDSFVTPMMQEMVVTEQENLDNVKELLPDTLEAVTEEQEIILVPVSWECVGDYDGTHYFYYQFQPVIREDVYEISEGVKTPYIWILRQSVDNLSKGVTKSENEKRIYEFLLEELNCNLATALGILANVERESSFNPKAAVKSGEKILYYGICQWGGSRLDDLKLYCEEKGLGSDTLEGQLKFLKHELYGKEVNAWKKMQGIENTADGAYLAGYNWARYFERCAAVYREVSAVRARDVYWPNYIEEETAPVYRISGASRYETGYKIADQLKQVLKIKKFEHVVVATGKGFADALSGSYLAYVKKAPILLTNGTNLWDLTQYVKKNLKDGGTIYLLGGESAIPKELEKQLEKYAVKRLSGKTRYETNLQILEEAGTDTKELLVCTGKGFADSLSASAAKRPILLVAGEMTEQQRAYLEKLKPEKIFVIGGENAVNAQIATELETYGNCTRISGKTRYETSVLAAEAFVENPEYTVLAYSKNFPDGLCGGPLAAWLNGPLVLTTDDNDAQAKKYNLKENVQQGFVLGGTGRISDDTVKNIFSLRSSAIITVY